MLHLKFFFPTFLHLHFHISLHGSTVLCINNIYLLSELRVGDKTFLMK